MPLNLGVSTETSPAMEVASEQAKKLFVGGIPPGTSEEMLKNYFNNYGVVEEVRVIRDPTSGRERGFGFVVFFESASAARALADQDHAINGCKIDVKKAKPRGQSSSQPHGMQPNNGRGAQNADANGGHFMPSNKVFVGGLPSNLTEAEFRTFFEQFGKVDDAVIIADRVRRRSRGFGFVTFESEDSVTSVLQAANRHKGGFFHQVGGKAVEVKVAVPRNYDEQIINGVLNSHECMPLRPVNLQGEAAMVFGGAYVVGFLHFDASWHYEMYIPNFYSGYNNYMGMYTPNFYNGYNNYMGVVDGGAYPPEAPNFYSGYNNYMGMYIPNFYNGYIYNGYNNYMGVNGYIYNGYNNYMGVVDGGAYPPEAVVGSANADVNGNQHQHHQ